MPVIGLTALTDNYIWLITTPKYKTFICIDPGDAIPILTYAKTHNLILSDIFITHHHHDHSGGVAKLLQVFPDISIYGPLDPRIPFVNRPVNDNQTVIKDENRFQVLNIPGHTSTHVCYYEPLKHWLFCGDTLFSAGCGRVFDGTIEDLYQSLQRLKHLPEQTEVYCGHEYTRNNLRFALTVEPNNVTAINYAKSLANNTSCSLPSTMKLECQINPFLRTHEPSLHLFAERNGIDATNELLIFKYLRECKNKF